MIKIVKKLMLLMNLIIIVNINFGLSMREITPNERAIMETADKYIKEMISEEMEKMEEKRVDVQSPLRFLDIYDWSLEYIAIKNSVPSVAAYENRENPKDDNIKLITYIEYRVDEEDLKALDKKKIKEKVGKEVKKKTGYTLEELEKTFFSAYPKNLVHKVRMITVEEIENELSSIERVFGIQIDGFKIKYGKTFTIKRGTKEINLDIGYSDFK